MRSMSLVLVWLTHHLEKSCQCILTWWKIRKKKKKTTTPTTPGQFDQQQCREKESPEIYQMWVTLIKCNEGSSSTFFYFVPLSNSNQNPPSFFLTSTWWLHQKLSQIERCHDAEPTKAGCFHQGKEKPCMGKTTCRKWNVILKFMQP